ncbi:MAG: ATP-binding protein, partial [Planctomycetes bacterium]|nr:ATP-binding protein [Planctomycetota bacterium]
LPVVHQEFAAYERANLHLALEELLSEEGRETELLGIVARHEYERPALAKLVVDNKGKFYRAGPVEYADLALADDQRLACVKQGLHLTRDDGSPAALLLSEEAHGPFIKIMLEVMAPRREDAEQLLRRVTRQTRLGRAFRGRVLSLEKSCYGEVSVKFHRLPKIRREDIVLPAELLDRIDRQTISFTRHAERLKAASRHLKRGILLHGPPGTGKTLTAMYLAAQMPERTVLVLTGEGIGSIETACNLARLLEPATVIIEDVDLIGAERQMQTVGANALLLELLNHMDGLAEDVDVLFVLTTNRPDILEPALAARPGRIDQAIEVPLPDGDCRRRLLELYGRGLKLELANPDRFVERTAGVSAAFIRELLRKAALFAAEEDGAAELTVGDRHLDHALAELLVVGGRLTQSLLGAAVEENAG